MLNLPLKGSTPVDTSGFVTSVTAGTGITMSGSATAPVVNVNQATAFAWTVAQSASVADAATATMTDVWTVTHTTSGTPLANYGTSELYRAHESVNALVDIGRIGFRWTAPAAPVASDFIVQTRTGGAALAVAMTLNQGLATFTGGVTAAGGAGSGGFRVGANVLVIQQVTSGNYGFSILAGSANSGIFTWSATNAVAAPSWIFRQTAKAGNTAESIGVHFDFATNAFQIGGSYGTQRMIYVQAPALTASGASTITTANMLVLETPSVGANTTVTGLVISTAGSSATIGPSAAAATYAVIDVPAHTVTYTNTTGSTATVGAAALRLGQITIAQNTGSGTLTETLAATLYIAGAPIAGTGSAITTTLALLVDAGASRFDGNIGFYGTAPVAQQTVGAVTNSVTSGGSDGTIADFTDLTVFANSAAAIRNDIYQLARSVNQLATAVRNLGLAA